MAIAMALSNTLLVLSLIANEMVCILKMGECQSIPTEGQLLIVAISVVLLSCRSIREIFIKIPNVLTHGASSVDKYCAQSRTQHG